MALSDRWFKVWYNYKCRKQERYEMKLVLVFGSILIILTSCKHSDAEVLPLPDENVEVAGADELGFWIGQRATSVGQVAVNCMKVDKNKVQLCYFTNRGTRSYCKGAIQRTSEDTRSIKWEVAEAFCKDTVSYTVQRPDSASIKIQLNLNGDTSKITADEYTLTKNSDACNVTHCEFE